MTDQGWMIDDGTCDACVDGRCYLCDEPREWATDDHGIKLVCCCNEGYPIGYADYPEGPNQTDIDPCGCWRQYDHHSELGPVATYRCTKHALLPEVEQ